MKKILTIMLSICIISSIFAGAISPIQKVKAETISYKEGDFVYSVDNDFYAAKILSYLGTAEKVIIPDKIGGCFVTSIDDNAFADDDNLISITIPSHLETFNYSVFQEHLELKEINVDLDNLNYKSKNGILYSKNGLTLLMFPPSKTEDCITCYEIAPYAFLHCKNLSKIYLAAEKLGKPGVTIIKNHIKIDEGIVFMDCPKLKIVFFYPDSPLGCKNTFVNCNRNFKIVHYETSEWSGSWNGYPTVAVKYDWRSSPAMYDIIEMKVGSKFYKYDNLLKMSDIAPIVLHKVIYVPLRTIVEMSGGSIQWDSKNKKAMVIMRGKEYQIFVRNPSITYDILGEISDYGPEIINGRIMVYLGTLRYELNEVVYYDKDSQTIEIYIFDMSE